MVNLNQTTAWRVDKIAIKSNRIEIPNLCVSDTYRYLGVDLNPDSKANVKINVKELITRIDHYYLKPQDKLAIIRTDLIPRLNTS